MDLRYAVLALAAAPLFGLACSTFGTAPDVDAGASAEASAPVDASTAADGAIPDRALPSSLDPDTALPGERDAGIADASPDQGTNPPDAAAVKKRVFVTAGTFRGAFAFGTTAGAQLAADAHCAAEASLGSSWYAYISVPTESAYSRLPDGVAWHLPGAVVGTFGALVFPSRAAIVLGPEVPITVDANGLPAFVAGMDDSVWTGTFHNGTIDFGAHCTSWTNDAYVGRVGSAAGPKATWTEGPHVPCAKSARFYCFER